MNIFYHPGCFIQGGCIRTCGVVNNLLEHWGRLTQRLRRQEFVVTFTALSDSKLLCGAREQ